MHNATPMLDIQHLVKQYGKNTAVDDISLTVQPGEFFGFLGPNGAGKTSTIGCITGTARITSGRILVDGIDVVTQYKEARRKIGVSAQEFNVDFFTKTHLLIEYMAGYHGMRRKERKERTQMLLEKFGLMEHKDKPFRELSGGLKRRVILARAIVHDPKLLILDEPTAGVDVEERYRLWGYLQELNAQGKTIILTSHYLEEVERLCNTIAIINHGKVVAQGSKQEFLKDGGSLEDRYLALTKDVAATTP